MKDGDVLGSSTKTPTTIVNELHQQSREIQHIQRRLPSTYIMLRQSVSRLGYTGDVWETAELKKLEPKIKNRDLNPDLSAPSGEEAEKH